VLDIDAASQYANIAEFIGWVFVRILPFLSSPELFSAEWRHRYNVLNDSFAFAVAGFEKPLGRAIEAFIREKFTFENFGPMDEATTRRD